MQVKRKNILLMAVMVIIVILSVLRYVHVNAETPEPVFIEYNKGQVFQKDNIDCNIDDIFIYSLKEFSQEYDIQTDQLNIEEYRNCKFIMVPLSMKNNSTQDSIIDFASFVMDINNFSTCLDLEVYTLINPEIAAGGPVLGLYSGSQTTVYLPFTIPQEHYSNENIKLYMSIYPEKKYVSLL